MHLSLSVLIDFNLTREKRSVLLHFGPRMIPTEARYNFR